VGRERETQEIVSLLKDWARLVTLAGPGGSGKTRLAIEAAAELVPEFKAGVFWVGLANLSDPALVPETIAEAIGSKNGLADHIGEREMLLLLDNLEQVVHAAPVLAALVEQCPNLRLLVTSRELLRVRGEVEYAVPPLSEQEAVELFCKRAQLEADKTIRALCLRLDCLPLAIELAAARAAVLSPKQIVERIATRLDLLKGGRDAEARQQTLRATIEWSHDLLTPEEQRLFSRLAVFKGGCAVEAAEALCAADLDTVQSLVDKNLLRRSQERLWMLETIREFALERLEASGEAEELRRRHAELFLGLVEEAEPYLYRESQTGGSEWLDRIEDELDNLRAALERFASCGDSESELRLAGAASEFWCARQHVSEGRRYLERALAPPVNPTRARAKALTAAAHMARDTGDAAAARARAEEGLSLHRASGDRWYAAHSLFWLGQGTADAGDFAQAAELHEEASRLFTEVGDEYYALAARRMLSWATWELGDRERARSLSDDNLRRAVALGARPLEASILGGQASRAVEEGRVTEALLLAAKSLRVSYELGAGTRTPSDDVNVAVGLCRCAAALALVEKPEEAAALLGCSETLHEELGVKPLPYLAAENERALTAIRSQLEDAALAEAWERGSKLRPDEAVTLALAALEDQTQATSAATSPQDIARLKPSTLNS
jgi:predicted ATPase